MKSQTVRYSAAYFALFTIYGVTSPYLQILIGNLGYRPAAVGLFLALFEVVGIVAPLWISHLADRAGLHRPALAMAGGAILASLPLLVLLPTPLATGIAIVSLSLGVKTIVPVMDSAAVAYLAVRDTDTSVVAATAKRSKGGYGGLRVMGSIGFIVMALAIQTIPGIDHSPPWMLALCVAGATLAFLTSLIFLPEAGHGRPGKAGPVSRSSRRIDPVFALGIVIIGIGRLAMAPVNSFSSLYAANYLHIDAVGALWAVATTAEVPFMLLSSRIIERTGTMTAIAISTAAVGLRLGIYALFPTAAGLFGGQLLHSLCYGLFQPAAVAFVAERVPPERRNTGMALYIGFGVGLPAVLGSALGGFVVEAAGYRMLFASFMAFAAVSVALWALFRRRFGSSAATRA
jgi:PPP family 3-phenylpropionic acid transporter